MAEEQLSSEKWHRKMAVDLFNYTWSLLDKQKRTPSENDEMINAAHSSRYHWQVRVRNNWDAAPINLGRGDWLISRVYAVLNRAEPAIYHAQRYLDICEQEGIKGWDLAYAYEGLARGYSVAGDDTKATKFLELAKKVSAKVKDENTRKMLIADLESIPGYSS